MYALKGQKTRDVLALQGPSEIALTGTGRGFMEHGTFTLKLCMVEVVYSSFTCDSHGATHALTIPLNHK